MRFYCKTLFALVLAVALSSCSRELAHYVAPQDNLYPAAETQPVDTAGDAADDPAIWVNKAKPQHSLILGTDKKLGLNVYTLDGRIQQQLPVGRLNNVDIRYGLQLHGQQVDLAAASNRSNNSISLFVIDNSGQVSHLTDIATDLTEVYGLCMYQDQQTHYVFINDKDGRYQQYQLSLSNNTLTGRLVRQFALNSQPEGCVADDVAGRLYMGEENTGIWTTSAKPGDSEIVEFAVLDAWLNADVEGMGIYHYLGQEFLVVSSQGTNSYVVYALQDNNSAIGHFRIASNEQAQLDGVSGTDGLEVTSVALGAAWPDGLLVVQDGHNQLPDAAQNFKLVSGSGLRKLIDKWLP